MIDERCEWCPLGPVGRCLLHDRKSCGIAESEAKRKALVPTAPTPWLDRCRAAAEQTDQGHAEQQPTPEASTPAPGKSDGPKRLTLLEARAQRLAKSKGCGCGGAMPVSQVMTNA
jgi:hypothetical protein